MDGGAAEGIEAHIDRCVDCSRLVGAFARAFVDDDTQAEPAAVSRRLASGERVGRYVIQSGLGEGGMGVVYRALDPDLDREVALKLVLSAAAATEARKRALTEARALARLAHPNVVAVHEVGEFEGQLYIAMEHVEGATLASWSSHERSLAARLDMLIQAGRGLAAAHDRGIIHRDFKPKNLLVGTDGRLRVLDFGLARHRDEQAPTLASPAERERWLAAKTKTGAILGTPFHVAPEQFDGRPADASSDQFAFCVVAFEALYGRRPFAGATWEELSSAVRSGRTAPVLVSEGVPKAVRGAIARGLSVEPSRRFPSMHALLAVLVEAADGKTPKRTRRLPLALAAVTAAVLAVAMVRRVAAPLEGRAVRRATAASAATGVAPEIRVAPAPAISASATRPPAMETLPARTRAVSRPSASSAVSAATTSAPVVGPLEDRH